MFSRVLYKKLRVRLMIYRDPESTHAAPKTNNMGLRRARLLGLAVDGMSTRTGKTGE